MSRLARLLCWPCRLLEEHREKRLQQALDCLVADTQALVNSMNREYGPPQRLLPGEECAA
jgi:hypothetical protein